MSVAIRAITRVQDADDAPVLGAGQDGYALTWDNASGAFVATNRNTFGSAGSDTIITLASQDATMNAKLYTAAATFYGVTDNLFGLVYNWSGPTTVQDASHPRWGLMFEHTYNTTSEGPIWDEYYLLWDDVTGGVSRRPFMAVVDRSTDGVNLAMNGRVTFSRKDATNSCVLIDDALTMLNNAPLRASYNGTSFLYQKDTTGNYRSLIYITSADQIYVGTGSLDVVLGAPNVTCTKNLFVANAYNSGNGVGVLAIKNAATVPTSWFTEGGLIYVEAGELKYRGSSGTITTLAAA